MTDNDKESPSELLRRMQRETVAAGYSLPEHTQEEPRWGGLAFSVGDIHFVTALTNVTDVVDHAVDTAVPCTQVWVRGIANVRGSLYSVVDLGVFLGIARAVPLNEGRLLVLNADKLGVALLVSRVYGLRYFDEETQTQDVSVLSRSVQPYASHAFLAYGDLWGVLDLNRLLESDTFLNIGTAA